MPNISPADAARIVRQAVTALSERLTGDYGELVPDASAERTAALLQKLEAGGESSAEDRGIRLADNAVLRDDTREAATRGALAHQLRTVRALAAPRHEALMEDARETELGA